MKILLVICITLIVNIAQSASQGQGVDPLVTIDQGTVRGRIATDGNYTYFMGIPYAQVDVNNPFGPAQPHPGFGSDIFDANDGSIRCPQLGVNRSGIIEPKNDQNNAIDCLRLNVYVPDEASPQNPVPIFLWIHGGVFASGHGAQFHPRNLVNLGIIVITVNYRLGVYGFMCLDTPLLPGNQGLKDQHEALRWVRNNIAAFGGNPDEVTIGGQSAGSSSVLLHLFSPMEKLFSKVIVQSGTPQSEGMFVESDLEAAVKIATHLGFETTDSEEALEFLSTQPLASVQGAATLFRILVRPCREKIFDGVENFFNTSPFTLSNIEKVRGTPVLMGHTSQEENRLASTGADYFSTNPFFNRIRDNYNLDDESLVKVADIMRKFYIGDELVTEDLRWELADFESDQKQNHPAQRIVTTLMEQNAGPIYNYVFSYVGDTGATAAGHHADVPYLFDTATSIGDSDEARLVAARMTTLWANFVKYGNPTPVTTDLLPITWPPVSADARPYIDIDADLQLKTGLYHDRMAFWDVFFRTYGGYHRLGDNDATL